MQTNETGYKKTNKQNRMKRKKKKNKGRAIALSNIWSKEETEDVSKAYHTYQVNQNVYISK
jgi:hypothetical protein